MKKRKRLTFIIKIFAFLSFVPHIVQAQKDSLSIANVIESFETKNGLTFAYDRGSMEALSLPRTSTESLAQFEDLILRLYQLCLTEVEEHHILVHRCLSDSWSLNAVVEDGENGEKLSFATIRVLNEKRTAIANVNGVFKIPSLTSNPVVLTVNYLGYQSDTLTIWKNDTVTSISCSPLAYTLNEVEILSLAQVVNIGGHHSHLSLEKNLLNSIPSIIGPDPLYSLRLLPGVGGNPESGSGLVFRGSKSDQTMILYDDIPLFHGDHFFGLFSSINEKSVKDIRIYRSGYGVKYSGFAGGLVRITSKEGDQSYFRGGITTDQFTTGGYLDIPIIKNKWSSRFTFRRDNSWVNPDIWNKNVSRKFLEKEITASNPSIKDASSQDAFYFFHDFTGKSVIHFDKRRSLTLGFQFGRDLASNEVNYVDSQDPYSLDLDFFSLWQNSGFSTSYHHYLGLMEAELHIGYSGYANSTEFGSFLEVWNMDTVRNILDFRQDNFMMQTRFRYDLDWSTKSGNHLKMGIDVPLFFSTLDQNGYSDSLSISSELFVPAFYAEYGHDISGWLIQIGNRINIDGEKAKFEPRVSVLKNLSREATFRLNFGSYNQYAQQLLPSIQEGLVPQYWLIPGQTEAPKMIKSHMIASGISLDKSGWSIDLESYYKQIQNITEQYPSLSRLFDETESSMSSVSSLSTFLPGESEILGLDLFLSRKNKQMTTWISGDISHVKNSVSANSSDYQPYYANVGNLKGGIIYTSNNIEVGLTWIGQFGRKFTDITNHNELTKINFGNASIPPYHRMDASATYKFAIGTVRCSIRNSLFNIYNRGNQKSVKYFQNSPTHLDRIAIDNLGFVYNLRLGLEF